MATRAEWIGQVGQEWARRGAALEPLLGPPGTAGLGTLAPRPGERVLDLGCGSGASTEALSDAVGPGGHVTAVDVSPDLLALAQARLAGRGNVELIEADAGRHAFAPAGHDALFSRFGAMFFDDPPAAFANLCRALRPGARAVFVAWRAPALNHWASVPMEFVRQRLGGAAPADGPGPFAWADPATYRPLLEGAGFGDVRETPHDFVAEIAADAADGDDPDPVARAVRSMTRIGPMARHLRDAPEDTRAAAAAFLADRLRPHVADGAVRLPASAWIIEARA